MPSIITHAIVGLSAASVTGWRQFPVRFWVLSAICPIIPDFDVLAFRFGLPYLHVLGHRGIFHSLFFALIVGLLVTLVFFRREKFLSRSWNRLAIYFSILTATHGLMDIFTDGGQGIALFSPFYTGRIFSPFRPIAVSPVGVRSFFSEWGIKALLSEMLWVWLPVLVVLSAVIYYRRRRNR